MSPRQRDCGSVSAAVDQSLPASVRDEGLCSSAVFNHRQVISAGFSPACKNRFPPLCFTAKVVWFRGFFVLFYFCCVVFFFPWIPEECVVLQVLSQTERKRNSLTGDSSPKADRSRQTTMFGRSALQTNEPLYVAFEKTLSKFFVVFFPPCFFVSPG